VGFQRYCAGVSAFMRRADVKLLFVEDNPESKACEKDGG